MIYDIGEAISQAIKIRDLDIEIEPKEIAFAFSSIRDDICDTLISVLRKLNKHRDIANTKEFGIDKINHLLKQTDFVLKRVLTASPEDKLAKNILFDKSFHRLSDIQEKSKNTADLLVGFLDGYNHSVANDDEYMSGNYKYYLNQFKRKYNEMEKLLEHSQKKIIEEQLKESALNFSELYKCHKEHETNWFFAFIASSIVMLLIVLGIYSASIPKGDYLDLMLLIFKKFLLLSVSFYAMKLTFGRYKTERNLTVLYNHRQKVLQQYKGFEAGIGDDAQAKNEFRMEIAKYIFSDPHFDVSEKGKAELNISPVYNMASKLLK